MHVTCLKEVIGGVDVTGCKEVISGVDVTGLKEVIGGVDVSGLKVGKLGAHEMMARASSVGPSRVGSQPGIMLSNQRHVKAQV